MKPSLGVVKDSPVELSGGVRRVSELRRYDKIRACQLHDVYKVCWATVLTVTRSYAYRMVGIHTTSRYLMVADHQPILVDGRAVRAIDIREGGLVVDLNMKTESIQSVNVIHASAPVVWITTDADTWFVDGIICCCS